MACYWSREHTLRTTFLEKLLQRIQHFSCRHWCGQPLRRSGGLSWLKDGKAEGEVVVQKGSEAGGGGGHGWAGHGAGRGFAAGPAVELPWGLASGRERGALLLGCQACPCLRVLTSHHVQCLGRAYQRESGARDSSYLFWEEGSTERLLVRSSCWQRPPECCCQGAGVGIYKWPSCYRKRRANLSQPDLGNDGGGLVLSNSL